jgi:hypothetical protein
MRRVGQYGGAKCPYSGKCPHDQSSAPCAILSCIGPCILTNFVVDVENMIIDKARLKREPHMALQFVAEVVECAYHNMGDERSRPIVKKFAKKANIPNLSMVENEANKIFLIAATEAQLAHKEQMNATHNAFFLAQDVRPHMWLQHSPFIGGDNCILNTQNIVQKLMDFVQDKIKLVGRPGLWGPTFDEERRPARRIRGDLNEPFAGSILPELLEICTTAPFKMLPDRQHLMTVLDLLQKHMNGGWTKAVPVALSFGLHAVSMSIYVVQGDGDLARIASYTKKSYTTLFAQLGDELSTSPENIPDFYWNVAMFKNIVDFAKPVGSKIDPRLPMVDARAAEQLAFWNPVIDGEYMLYVTYMFHRLGIGDG